MPRRTTDDDAPLRDWLIENGLPRFTVDYSFRDNLPVLANILFAVLAFELGMAPWLYLTGTVLILALPFLAAVTISAHLAWRRLHRTPRLWDRAISLWVIAASALALGVATTWLLPGVWSDYTLDALTIYLLLHATFLLAQGNGDPPPTPPRRHKLLVPTVLGVIALLALEDAKFEDWDTSLWGFVSYPDRALALALAIVILWLSRPDDRARAFTGTRSLGWETLLGAAPVLVLLLCADLALLGYFFLPQIWEIALPLALVPCIVLISASTAQARRTRRSRKPPPRGGVTTTWMWGWSVIYLSGYPIALWLSDESVDLWGLSVSGPVAALYALCVNVVFLGVAVFAAAIAVDRIGSWAWQQIIRDLPGIRQGLTAHLPLILIFAAFFLFTAEAWEIAAETPPTRPWTFWALVGVLLATSWLLLVEDARHSIDRARRITAADVRSVIDAGHGPGLTPLPDGTLRRLSDRMPPDTVELRLDLSGLRRLNASIVVGFYQAVLFGPLLILSALTFWALAHLSVAPQVATTWICGDEPRFADDGSASADDLTDTEPGAGSTEPPLCTVPTLDGLEDPWLRVALLLAAFALLERVVRILTEPAQRKTVLGPAEAALHVQFAVALLNDLESVDRHEGAGAPTS